jgi:hypothetical protein
LRFKTAHAIAKGFLPSNVHKDRLPPAVA